MQASISFYFFFSFPSLFSPFLISKMQLIGKNSSSEPILLTRTPRAPRVLPALWSPCRGRSLQRVPDPPPTLPTGTHLAASKPRDKPSRRAGGTEKPMANPVLGWQDPKRAVAVFWKGWGAIKAEEHYLGCPKGLRCPKWGTPSQAGNAAVLYSLYIYHTYSTDLRL